MEKSVFSQMGDPMFPAGRTPIDRNYLARLAAFLFLIVTTGLLFVFISLQMKKIVSSISKPGYTNTTTRL